MKKVYEISFRCFYPSGEPTTHRQTMKLTEIAKWIEAYKFTHPACNSITIKIWLKGVEQ